MGVLSNRLHGPITGIAALTAASLWTDGPDKPYIRSFLNATGEALLLSSLYAPMASSSFDIDVVATAASPSIPLEPGHVSMRSTGHTLPPLPDKKGPSPSSQSSTLEFYRAMPHSMCGNSESPRQRRLLAFPTSLFATHPVSTMGLDAGSHHWASLSSSGHASWRHFTSPQFERKSSSFLNGFPLITMPTSTLLPDWQHRRHPGSAEKQQLVKHKPTVVVVLLGWLGAEQRHLKRYADWYTSRGIHAVTFVVPMKDLLTLKAGAGAEKYVDGLTAHLMKWLEDDEETNEKHLLFHTFSNTGWLIYGAVLERLIGSGDKLLNNIKGCVVDSAPSARPDPHVWASGFAAALLKKGSSRQQKLYLTADMPSQPSFKEAALLTVLEKFFSIFLQLPYVNRRLNGVVTILSKQQPTCPQLYIYSTADTVIPASSVEDFVEEQRKAGRLVSACNFECSPHVDHFRTFPERYSEQLTSFLALCFPHWANKQFEHPSGWQMPWQSKLCVNR